MQLRNRFYSYPVIIKGGNYYDDSSFSSTVELERVGYNIKLTLTADLKDEKLLKMIENNDVVYVHHIECPQTCFRKIVKTKDPIDTLLLRSTEINGVVQICSFVVANRNINKYTNDSFSSDYRGFKFNIDKGCVMAVGNQFNVHINKEKDDLINTSSIFSIVKKIDPIDETISINLNQHKIIIALPRKTFDQYFSIQNYIDIQPVLHSMLIIPTLIYTFSELRQAGDQFFEYENKRWFRGLNKACKAIDVELSEENLQTMDIVKVSQLLLDNPISKAIAYCTMGGGSSYED
ncbi:hypothetical protein [Absicoccus porci]|uniref:hypothetical protein n=1 Tax=Absicoccus porci TaxID=2486576 RepID=UPI002943C544|nr:hypothetical protein [Absicoccus porci]